MLSKICIAAGMNSSDAKYSLRVENFRVVYSSRPRCEMAFSRSFWSPLFPVPLHTERALELWDQDECLAKVKMCLTEAVALIQDKYGSVKTETLEGGECSYSNLPSVIN